MRFDGNAILCSMLEGGIAELRFDLKDDSVNKLNQRTMGELTEVVALLQKSPEVKGLLVTSGKDGFLEGADINEFFQHLSEPEDKLAAWITEIHKLFCTIEDFNFPVVSAINGLAVGGGLEFALSTSYRVMSSAARVGLPETKLGIFPGWGGTVRLSRVSGADTAIAWIAGGDLHVADESLKLGVVDAVVPPAKVQEAALDLLNQAVSGKRDWKARRLEKTAPLKLNTVEASMVFSMAKTFAGGKAGPNYPAPIAAIEAIEKGSTLGREEALAIEATIFTRTVKTPSAAALVSNFLGDQYVGKFARKVAKAGSQVQSSAVVGAGIMGGGIAYLTASKGTPIIMKDIAEKALALGMSEAEKLLVKAVERGTMKPTKMAQVLGRIKPTLSYEGFQNVDLVVDAVVENEKVKNAVLADLEGLVKADAVLASNTSTISITRLAEGLKRPENFCGMHFFNPVPKMALVEIIRGAKSSDRTIASAVSYALALGKTPIVINDCPGFLVNRILFPYWHGFNMLVNEGVDFQRIDKVMEKFGWPMGPAYLADVCGIDTVVHADAILGQGFPDRMVSKDKTAMTAMFEAQRFGQKNDVGFFKYVPDKKGIPRKQVDPDTAAIIKSVVVKDNSATITDQDIIDRMMLPVIIEGSRCLEDKIVGSPTEVDMGLLYGLGFPPFRGGALYFADKTGLKAVCEKAGKFKSLGKLYEPTAQMIRLAETGSTFYEAR